MTDPDLMEPREVAAMFAVSVAATRVWAKRGRVLYERDAKGDRRFFRAELEAFFASVGGVVEVMTLTQVRVALRLHARGIAELVDSGRLRTVQTPGGNLRYVKSDVDAIKGARRPRGGA